MEIYKCVKPTFQLYLLFDYESKRAFIKGSIYDSEFYFKQINRRPPNIYGNFYGREKAGFKACCEIIEKFKEDFIKDK